MHKTILLRIQLCGVSLLLDSAFSQCRQLEVLFIGLDRRLK